MNTLTDFLVYAGFVGLGFAFVEDLLYLSGAGSVGETILVSGPSGSSSACSLTRSSPRPRRSASTSRPSARGPPGMRVLYGVGGYVGAMTLHAIWNGSTSLGLVGYLLVYVCVCVPLVRRAGDVAVRSRRSEGQRLNLQLPLLVADGPDHGPRGGLARDAPVASGPVRRGEGRLGRHGPRPRCATSATRSPSSRSCVTRRARPGTTRPCSARSWSSVGSVQARACRRAAVPHRSGPARARGDGPAVPPACTAPGSTAAGVGATAPAADVGYAAPPSPSWGQPGSPPQA